MVLQKIAGEGRGRVSPRAPRYGAGLQEERHVGKKAKLSKLLAAEDEEYGRGCRKGIGTAQKERFQIPCRGKFGGSRPSQKKGCQAALGKKERVLSRPWGEDAGGGFVAHWSARQEKLIATLRVPLRSSDGNIRWEPESGFKGDRIPFP